MEEHPRLEPVAGGGDRLRDVVGQVVGGRGALDEAPGRGHLGLDAVHPEGAPVRAPAVPRHEVPAPSGAHEAQRLHLAPALLTARVAIGEPQPLRIAAGAGEHGQDAGIHLRPPARVGHGGRSDRADPAPDLRRQHLLELGQRTDRGLLDASDAGAGRRAQADHHGHRLALVEQQRRQRCAGGEPVPAGHAPPGLHRVPQAAQPLDVAAHCARPHRRAGPRARPRASRGASEAETAARAAWRRSPASSPIISQI